MQAEAINGPSLVATLNLTQRAAIAAFNFMEKTNVCKRPSREDSYPPTPQAR
jgi:hypothetical protein